MTARFPDAAELAELRGALEDFRRTYATDPEAAEALLRAGEHPADPSVAPAEQAAWTLLGSLLLNLDEAITKS